VYNNGFPGKQYPYHFSPGVNDFRNVQNTCQKYMNYHVIGQMSDGSQVEGIIEDMDDEGVTMLVPEIVEEDQDDVRIWGYGGYGGYGGGYRRRYRRYRRRRYPYYQFVFPFILPIPIYY
jgi:hypothetical protein